MSRGPGLFLGMLGTVAVLCGCDPLTVHNVTSTLLDGAPSPPASERLCAP